MQERNENGCEQAHVVCIPYPSQGHINPMMKLAKLLHSNHGFHITFVHTEHSYQRLLRSRGPSSLRNLPSFRFETIPDGLPPSDLGTTQNIPEFCKVVKRNCTGPFVQLLQRLKDDAARPRLTCVVADGVLPFTLPAAEEVGLKVVMLWTASACGLLGYAQIPRLIHQGYIPLKDASCLTNGYLDTPIEWIPSMRGVRLKDMPEFTRTTDRDDIMLAYMQSVVETMRNSTAIIINTFNAMETQVLASLASDFPPIYPIGPLHLLAAAGDTTQTASLRSNMWAEEDRCIEWLDSMSPGSVLYVNFGSLAVVTNDFLVELATGLARSLKPFLWIIRPDIVSGESTSLPDEFLAETKERSLVVSWCDQEKVLGHRAIGGFLSHGGWNSILESIGNGLPMILCPFGSEQQTNCWFCCEHWGIGMELELDDGRVKSELVEKLVTELMCGEKGTEMKKEAIKWKSLAHKAMTGESCFNFSNLVHQLRSIGEKCVVDDQVISSLLLSTEL